jgi:LysM repeat protein
LLIGGTAYAQGQKFSLSPSIVQTDNSQTMSLLEGHLNTNPNITAGSGLAVVDDSALLPEIPESDTYIDAGVSGTGEISVYTVRQGDTLPSIAKMFGVSANTIVWANNIKNGKISVGDDLVILPISGVRHTVVKGDTLESIAKLYKADMGDILSYNGLTTSSKLSIGEEIIVPDGELGAGPASGTSSGSSSGSSGSSVNSCGLHISHYERLLVNPCNYPSYPGYYLRPISGGVKTQELHGYNAVDLAAPIGTTIRAAADGTVIVSRTSGYNGGYGIYVVISHPNGTQTLYAHMSHDSVTVGQKVSQGDPIGAIGMTGDTTGPHVHFEVRGARNPF